jgi:hypothetical protein
MLLLEMLETDSLSSTGRTKVVVVSSKLIDHSILSLDRFRIERSCTLVGLCLHRGSGGIDYSITVGPRRCPLRGYC